MAKEKIMSTRLKEEIAKELGFYDVVQKEGWGGIKARDAGNMVKRAVEMAQESLAAEERNKNIQLGWTKKRSKADGRGRLKRL